jgi:hypothetical protein
LIKYDLPKDGSVKIKVYNVLGNEIITLVNEEMPMGTHEAEFNATGLTNRVYFYRLVADSFNQKKRYSHCDNPDYCRHRGLIHLR